MVAQLRDLARLNRWFGGTKAVVRALEPLFARAGSPPARGNGHRRWTLLDIGTGAGDIALAVRAAAGRRDLDLVAIGVERIPAAARLAREHGLCAVVGDGSALPFGPKSVDIVTASQVLHHLRSEVAVQWIAAFDRLARRAVVLADLHRSRLAVAGMSLLAAPLGFGQTTRHDAVVSLRRGYTVGEFRSLLEQAGVRARVTTRRWARIVAVWEP